MARERKVQTDEKGNLFFELKRKRVIAVPGTKGLKRHHTERVPQIEPQDTLEDTVSGVLNIIPGKTDDEKIENFVSILNNGLIKDAEARAASILNKAINDASVVSEFGKIVELSKLMFPALSDVERAEKMLELSPDLAAKLKEAGIELADDDDEVDEDEDETDE